MDFDERTSLESVVRQHDLIIHTAGPFQGLKETTILDSCLQNGKAYLDVCDDVKLSRQSRSEEKRALARKTGAAAVISTGIWPGGSSLFAQEVINKAGGNTQVQEVKFSFFTAGSGNAGPTILTATFLILGEDVLTYVDGKEVFRKSATDVREVDFGEEIGVREVVRLNLIECESCFQSGIPNVETHFGTAPKLWNRLFALMAQVIPQNVLQDRSMMMWFANFSLPMVRLIDTLVGSSNGT
jgi:saccharopine dehydrogenase-like NADP-dependent oxidoreductase